MEEIDVVLAAKALWRALQNANAQHRDVEEIDLRQMHLTVRDVDPSGWSGVGYDGGDDN